MLVPILDGAGVNRDGVFFTNVLMGCKPGSALGKMPSVEGYEDQCLRFLQRQIEIVRPRVVVALGHDARKRLARVFPNPPKIAHPSWRGFILLATREARIAETADLLRRYATK